MKTFALQVLASVVGAWLWDAYRENARRAAPKVDVVAAERNQTVSTAAEPATGPRKFMATTVRK